MPLEAMCVISLPSVNLDSSYKAETLISEQIVSFFSCQCTHNFRGKFRAQIVS